MDFNLGKTAEELQQKIKHIFLNRKSTDTIDEFKFSASESEELKEGLSGEYISSGFTDAESEELINSLSGTKSIEYLTVDGDGQKKNLTFYGEEREGFLELTPDSLQFYINIYPNIAKAYIKGSIVTLLDSNNSPILDSMGKPVIVDYTQSSQSDKINLISFYLNHLEGKLDVNKLFKLKELQDRINLTPQTDKSYAELQSEIEVQKFEMMNDNERKNYMSAKMLNAFNNGDKISWFNALNEFYKYKCKIIDKKFGITGTKEFLDNKTYFNDLIAYIDKIVDNAEDKLTKTKLMLEILNGIGEAIDFFIGTQGLTMMGISGTGTKASPSVPKTSPVLEGAIQAYFGTENASLIVSGVIDSVNTETNSQVKTADAKNSAGDMTKNESKSFIEGFKGLEVKDFRNKISEILTLDDLTIIRKMIEELPYSKVEKRMLQNKCTKQQGKIQRANVNDEAPQHSPQDEKIVTGDASAIRTCAGDGADIKDRIKKQKVRSQTAYAIFKECKTSVQREMAKIILNDSRICMPEQQLKFVYEAILKNCKTKSDLKIKQKFIAKMMENPKLLNEDGMLAPNLIYCLRDVNTEIFDMWIDILNEYQKTNSKLNNNSFAYMMLFIRKAKDAELFKKFLNNNKINFDLFDTYTHDELQQICKILLESNNGQFGKYCKIPIEEIINNYNLRKIVSTHVQGGSANDIEYIRDKLLLKEILRSNKEPFLLNYEGTIYDYSNKIKNLLEHLGCSTDSHANEHLARLFSDVILDEKLWKNPKTLESLFDESYGTAYHFEVILKAIKNGAESLSQQELELFFIDAYMLKADFSSYINRFINNSFKPVEGSTVQIDILNRILMNDRDLFKDFTTNRIFTDEDLDNLLGKAHMGYGKDILENLCKQQEYSAKDIFDVMNHTLEHSVDLTKKILGVTNLTSKEKVDLIVSLDVRDSQLENLISILINQENLDLRTIPKILEAVKILDEHDANGNNWTVDPAKLDRYISLIKKTKTSSWVIKMLNAGWDIETISKLSPAKQEFYMKKMDGKIVEVKDKNVKFFMNFGLEMKEAEAIVKAISQNGILNIEMQKTAIDLINAGIPKNHIGNILSSATITGEYNPRIPADAMAIKNLGLNAFVERYLPFVNNLSPEDIASKFNPKMKKRLVSMIENIPEDTKPALRAKGFDLEGAVIKLKTELKNKS